MSYNKIRVAFVASILIGGIIVVWYVYFMHLMSLVARGGI